MNKTSSDQQSSDVQKDTGAGKKKSAKKPKKQEGIRETVESVAIAFILAFLFKTFQAEAYVIPTGSMAPTLYGRHKEITCDGCGFEFALGASSELDQESGYLVGRLNGVVCSNCGKLVDCRNAPVFNGDRILVNKQVNDYERFDVVVFKNPEQGRVNYIKRLVGLPNETIRIRKGDIWAKAAGESEWKLQRKQDPSVQKDIQLTVYDDNYPAIPMLELGWPERWAPCVAGSGDGSTGGWQEGTNAWTPDYSNRSYASSTDAGESWLRYRHFFPDKSTWPDPLQQRPVIPAAEASLIADFCSFNAYVDAFEMSYAQAAYWVGDLTINATVELESAEGELTLELVEGRDTFQCRIDLSTGRATLLRADTGSNDFQSMATGETELSSAGSYEVTFANVDDRLCLWVDNKLTEFDADTTYESSDLPQPTDHDLSPVGIATTQADLVISNLLLERDIYYRNDIIAFDQKGGAVAEQRNHVQHEEVYRPSELQGLLTNPDAWAAAYAVKISEQLSDYSQFGEYQLDPDEYLMFGDNSSMSKDSRLFDYVARPENGVFSHRYAVRERDLIGKALYIFWPHGVPFLNDGEGFPIRYHKAYPRRDGEDPLDAQNYPSVRVPFYPNIHRMKKIR